MSLTIGSFAYAKLAKTTRASTRNPKNSSRLLLDPTERLLEFPLLIDDPLNTLQERLLIDLAVEIDLEQVEKRRIYLHLVDKGEFELVLCCPERPQRRLPALVEEVQVLVRTALAIASC